MRKSIGWKSIFALIALSGTGVTAVDAQNFQTLVHFRGGNGARPWGALVQGIDGNFYGTTAGVRGKHPFLGSVYRITPGGTLTTLESFPGHPFAGLLELADGSFYGTTSLAGRYGVGRIFEIGPSGTVQTLYSFCSETNCADGEYPGTEGLVQATDGDLYGAAGGGAHGGGTLFQMTSSNALTTIYSFCARPHCSDGAGAVQFIQGADGNFYGTTSEGGTGGHSCLHGCGTVFQMTPQGALTTLHRFCAQAGCPDSAVPEGGVIQGSDGNFYGTTQGEQDGGSVFKITADGAWTKLYTFCSQPNCADGEKPRAGLLLATDGNFYGTTSGGGVNGRGGTIFKMTPDGTLTTLYSFCGGGKCRDGGFPGTALTEGTDGNLYGTTLGSAYPNEGTVFLLSTGLTPFVKPVPASGTVGANVMVLGTNLTGATAVTFNRTPATGFVVNSTGSAILATVPAGATSGTIQVTLPGGATLSSNLAFIVTP